MTSLEQTGNFITMEDPQVQSELYSNTLFGIFFLPLLQKVTHGISPCVFFLTRL